MLPKGISSTNIVAEGSFVLIVKGNFTSSNSMSLVIIGLLSHSRVPNCEILPSALTLYLYVPLGKSIEAAPFLLSDTFWSLTISFALVGFI